MCLTVLLFFFFLFIYLPKAISFLILHVALEMQFKAESTFQYAKEVKIFLKLF